MYRQKAFLIVLITWQLLKGEKSNVSSHEQLSVLNIVTRSRDKYKG